MNIDKWREGIIDPYSIELNNGLVIEEIISYPHAANDVYKCVQNDIVFYLKIEREKTGNVLNESNILEELSKYDFKVPKVLDKGIFNTYNYLVTSEVIGLRLSEIKDFNKELCLREYGRMLSKIHSLKIKSDNIKQRKINSVPTDDKWMKYPILEIYMKWLNENKISIDNDTFIHGDFHYANILFLDNKISGILDFEYSGMGFREQDIAWSLVRRQTQKFLKTKREVKLFLDGYKEKGTYDEFNLKWCLVNAYVHYYIMNKEKDLSYSKFIIKKLNELTS